MTTTRRPWKRRIAVTISALLGVWIISAIWLLSTAWHRLPGYAPESQPDAVSLILTPDEYSDVIDAHDRPYLYELSAKGNGAVLVFGAEHTKDPGNPQISSIRNQWAQFKPTVALIESDLGMMFPAFMDPVHTFGEVGAVYELATKHGAEAFTWEPTDERIIHSAIEQGHTPEQVALRWVLSPYFSNLRHGKPDDPEAFVTDTLTERSLVPGIKGQIVTMNDLESTWNREFPDGPDWRDVSDQYRLPGYLAEIDLNQARDEHLVSCIAELTRNGDRVFVICGSSHAVKIEPALRALNQ